MKTKIFVSLVFVLLAVLLAVGVAGAEYDPCGHFMRWTIPGFNSEPMFWFGSDPATSLTLNGSYTASGRFLLIGLDDVWVTGVDPNNLWGCYAAEITQEQVDTWVAEGNYPECVIVDAEGNFQSYDLSSGARCLLPEMPPTPTPTVTPTPMPEPTQRPYYVTLAGGINTREKPYELGEGDVVTIVTENNYEVMAVTLGEPGVSSILYVRVEDTIKPRLLRGEYTEEPEYDYIQGEWILRWVQSDGEGVVEVIFDMPPPPFLPGKEISVCSYPHEGNEPHVECWRVTVTNGRHGLFLPLVFH